MATLSEKANDAVFHIDEDDDDNNSGDEDADDDIEQETGAQAAEGLDDDDIEVLSAEANESRFRTIADGIWSWSRPAVNLK